MAAAVMAAVLGGLLVACSPGVDVPVTPSAAVEVSTGLETGVAQAPGTDAEMPGSVVEGEWDPASWEPTVTIVAEQLTEEERQEARDEFLEMVASGKGIESHPQVDLVRWTLGPADYAEQVAACLREAGFSAEGDRDGGISYNPGVPPSQQEAHSLAFYVCHAQYTPDPAFLGDWTPEQTGLVYDYWDQYFIPCIAAHGHEISRADQPSRDAYVANFLTSADYRWWPTEDFYSLTPAEQEQLAPACAPMPPLDVMYGHSGG